MDILDQYTILCYCRYRHPHQHAVAKTRRVSLGTLEEVRFAWLGDLHCIDHELSHSNHLGMYNLVLRIMHN